MTLAHGLELDPTVKQREYFARACGTARLVWNGALARWHAEYEAGAKAKASELKRRFNRVKYQQFPWLTNIHRDAHAQPFADLSQAFRNFFEGRARHPRFKKKGKCRDSFYIANDQFSVNGSSVRLPMIGSVRMTEAPRFTGKIQSAMVNRDADRWLSPSRSRFATQNRPGHRGSQSAWIWGARHSPRSRPARRGRLPNRSSGPCANCGGWADGTLASHCNHVAERRPAGNWLVNTVVSEISVMSFCTNSQPISLKPTAPSESRT